MPRPRTRAGVSAVWASAQSMSGAGARQEKNTRTLYWIVTGVAAAFMLLASIPDVLQVPEAMFIFRHLGYPAYLLPFLGTAKTLGIVAVVVPSFQRLKEWAFAGLVYRRQMTRERLSLRHISASDQELECA